MQQAYILFIFSFVHLYSVQAQTTIKGRVTDSNHNGIPGVNVYLLDTYDGATTDTSGNFHFTTTESGEHVLIVNFVGYKQVRTDVELKGVPVFIETILKEQINELEAVTISAGAFTANDASRRTVFKALDIATTAGATADIAGALNTLPGTQKAGESGRLFVRGGDGSEARTFIDGMVVLEAYGTSAPNTPSRGRFLPFMFKGISFSTGGYSAEYGQALSSALVLESKDESETIRTDIGLLSVGGDIAHTHAWDGGSATAKIQYTNIRPYYGMINQEIDWKTAPASIEGVAAFRQRVGKAGMVKVYGNFNQTDFALYNHSLDDGTTTLLDLTNRYRYINTFYKNSLGDNWLLRGGLSYNYIQNDASIDLLQMDELEKGIHGKMVLEGSLTNYLEVKTGVEVVHRTYDQQFKGDNAPAGYQFDESIPAAFIEVDLLTSNNFVTRAGGRIEYNTLQEDAKLSPRISLAYKTGASSQVSLAYGNFHQTAKNEYVKLNTNLKPEEAVHYIFNYQHIDNNRTFRIETFYKEYDHLIKFDLENIASSTNTGSGYAKGVELFWRDKQSLPSLDYWVSYSYLDTERDYLNFPGKATPAFASAHNFSLVTKYFVQSWKSQLGLTFSYTSGRPYHNPNADGFNTERTPSYQDLSFNWSFLPKPHLVIYLSCTNLLGRDNIFGYEYSTSPNDAGTYNGRAIRHPAPRFLFLGIFITLSKDKSMSQLPNL